MNFLKANLAFFKLAILQNLTYRWNFVADAVLQPLLAGLIEIFLWFSIFKTAQLKELGGFPLENYLAYTLFGTAVTRITTNWMYEDLMSSEVERGRVNNYLVKPITFYEAYLSQYLGYKFITSTIGLIFPFLATFFFNLPIFWERIPGFVLHLILSVYFTYALSFLVVCLAFHFVKTHTFTLGKNLLLWFLSGELIPLDLIPGAWRTVLLELPFSHGVYHPVSFIIGRTDPQAWMKSLVSLVLWSAAVTALGAWTWKRSLRSYSGTEA